MAPGSDSSQAEQGSELSVAAPKISWLGLALRLLGLGVVVWVLAGHVHWWDRVAVDEQTNVVGIVEAVEGNTVRIRSREGVSRDYTIFTQDKPSQSNATRVQYGLRSLGRRLIKSWPTVMFVLLGLMGLIVLTAWRWHALLHAARIGLSRLHTIKLTWIGSFFNLAFPGSTGGDVVKAILASRATGAPTRSVLSVFGDRALGILGLIVLAAVVLVVYPHDSRVGLLRVTVLLLLLGALLAAAVVFSPRLRRVLGLRRLFAKLPFQSVLSEASECGRLYGARPGTLGGGLLISVVNHAGLAIAVWILAGALGTEGVTLSRAILLVPLANLVSAIPLLPGGWGVGEAAFAYFFGLVGVPATEAVSLSVVYRLAVLASSLPGGVLWLGLKQRPIAPAA